MTQYKHIQYLSAVFKSSLLGLPRFQGFHSSICFLIVLWMLLRARGTFSTLKRFTFRGTLTSVFAVFVLWRKLMKRVNTEPDQLAVVVHMDAYIRLHRNSDGQAPKFGGDNCNNASNCIWLNAPLRCRTVFVIKFKEVVSAAVRY